MFLAEIAQRHMNEDFIGWDKDTHEFNVEPFTGRLGPTDRFLSIYNRPVRKRQLQVRPETELPSSGVCFHPATKEVYLLGSRRQDARGDVDGGSPYVEIVMAHLVTGTPGGSSGLAVHTRKQPVGPADDPGWLEEVEIQKTYLDMEFRTSSAEAGLVDTKIENFYAWASLIVEVNQDDTFHLEGITYRVVDSFTDMGLRGMRLDRMPDTRVNFVITRKQEPYFDRSINAFVSSDRDYNVTGKVTDDYNIAHWVSNDNIKVVIDRDHIGFTPTEGLVISYQGRQRAVESVYTQDGERQFTLVCK